MRKGFGFIILAMLWSGFLFPATPDSWQSGKMVSAVLNGQGSRDYNRADHSSGWWNYCISAGDRFYSVVSSQGPAKLGLLHSKPVRFSVSKNRFVIVSPAGKQVSLRILRKNISGTCR